MRNGASREWTTLFGSDVRVVRYVAKRLPQNAVRRGGCGHMIFPETRVEKKVEGFPTTHLTFDGVEGLGVQDV
jgi:hypothetical protein